MLSFLSSEKQLGLWRPVDVWWRAYLLYEKNYKALIDTMSKDEILSQSILEYNVLEDRIIYAFDEFNHSGIGFDEYDS